MRHSAEWFALYRKNRAKALGLPDPDKVTDAEIKAAEDELYRRQQAVRLGLDPDTATEEQIVRQQFGLPDPAPNKDAESVLDGSVQPS